jgi:hypothetical protein
MFWDQITKAWGRRLRELAIMRGSTPTADPEDDCSNGEASIFGRVFEEAAPEPFAPANDARSSENSLHLSC